MGNIAKDDDEVFMCIEEEGDSIVRIMSIHKEQSKFALLDLVFGLRVEDFDPFCPDFATCSTFLLVTDACKKVSPNCGNYFMKELTKL